ncbi:Beta-alanine--pyruvate aminotransferase [compost metagenome]
MIDVRNLGLVSGIELAPRAGAPGARAAEVFQKCFDSGLMVRYTGDIIAVSPPLIIDEAQIGQIFEQIGKVLKEVA